MSAFLLLSFSASLVLSSPRSLVLSLHFFHSLFDSFFPSSFLHSFATHGNPSHNSAVAPSSIKIALAVLRIPKMARLYQIFSYFTEVEDAIEEWSIAAVSPDAVKMFKLILGVVIVSHIFGCLFFLTASEWLYGEKPACAMEDDTVIFNLATLKMTNKSRCEWTRGGVEPWVVGSNMFGTPETNSWVIHQTEDDLLLPGQGQSLGQWPSWYVRALNWALPTLVVVVIGDVIPVTVRETVFAFAAMIVGMIINALIIGNIAAVVASLDTPIAKFRTKVDELEGYFEAVGLPSFLCEKAIDYLEYEFGRKMGFDEDEMMDDLPYTLRMEVVSHQRYHTLKSCLLFESLEASLLRRIGFKLTSLVASPGDEIVRENDIGYSMFFLTKGFANVVSNNPKTLYSTVVTGSFFGESALFKESKRVASVVAVGYCELLELARHDLDVSWSEGGRVRSGLVLSWKVESGRAFRSKPTHNHTTFITSPHHHIERPLQVSRGARKDLAHWRGDARLKQEEEQGHPRQHAEGQGSRPLSVRV